MSITEIGSTPAKGSSVQNKLWIRLPKRGQFQHDDAHPPDNAMPALLRICWMWNSSSGSSSLSWRSSRLNSSRVCNTAMIFIFHWKFAEDGPFLVANSQSHTRAAMHWQNADVFVINTDGAFVTRYQAYNHVEGGFSCAVWPKQSNNLARFYFLGTSETTFFFVAFR